MTSTHFPAVARGPAHWVTAWCRPVGEGVPRGLENAPEQQSPQGSLGKVSSLLWGKPQPRGPGTSQVRGAAGLGPRREGTRGQRSLSAVPKEVGICSAVMSSLVDKF